jgi:hypothetical protein
MTSQRPDQERKAHEARQEPKRQGRQRTPQRQVWSVIHVERREQQDVRNGHAGDVDREPPAPEPTPRSPPNDAGGKGQDAENKEARIVGPSQDGKGRHGQEDDHQTPSSTPCRHPSAGRHLWEPTSRQSRRRCRRAPPPHGPQRCSGIAVRTTGWECRGRQHPDQARSSGLTDFLPNLKGSFVTVSFECTPRAFLARRQLLARSPSPRL